MDTTARPRRRALGTLITAPAWAGAALGAGCASPSGIPPPAGAEPLPAPALRVGDRWRYRVVNVYNRATIGEAVVQVVSVAPELRLRVDPGTGGPMLEERYADPWTVVAEPIYDAPMVFESPMAVVPPGARTGQWLRASTHYRSERSTDRLAWQQTLRVVGWDRVQVPAGTFDALRIERVISFQHPDFFRFDPDRTDVLWYAPQVGRWVVREWTGTFMLGSPTPRSGRARDDWVRWELVAHEPAAR